HFQTPGSLSGNYGTYTFKIGRASCRERLNQSVADPLTDGKVVHDHLMVKSVDGTATYDIDVTITGTNDNATITASAGEDTAVKENGGIGNATVGDPRASGLLTAHAFDSGEYHFQTPGSLSGNYGTYTF